MLSKNSDNFQQNYFIKNSQLRTNIFVFNFIDENNEQTNHEVSLWRCIKSKKTETTRKKFDLDGNHNCYSFRNLQFILRNLLYPKKYRDNVNF